MAQNVRLSRLNPVYLAKRHAGAFLLVLALGLAVGLVVQAVFMPRKYWSSYSRSFFVSPPSSAANLDWNGKNREWSGLAANASTRTVLTANLRSGMKRLLADHLRPFDASPEKLRNELLAFRSPQILSTAPGSGPIRARIGPKVEIARHDLAANLDFQALALVVADLDPRSGATGWDFADSMAELVNMAPTDWIIAKPGPTDPFFKVFYRLHAILNQGAVADSPAEAWQTAVAEVGARLVRETEFQGGGGFGPAARGEILLEIGSLPVLVANSLYGAAEAVFGDDTEARQEARFWEQKWLRDASIRIEHDGAARGRLDIEMRNDLHFLSFPFDSPLTRVAPLAVRTLYAYIEAWERNAEPPPAPEAPPPPPEPELPAEPEPRAETIVESVEPAEPVSEPDSSRIRELEAALHQARLDRDDVGRRLEAARMALEGLAGEAGSAREHADRLKERLEAAELLVAETVEPEPDPNLVVLLDEREFLLRRLAELLQYCTDQHPFVIQIRRQLAALEGRIALFAIEAPDRTAGERRARLANLRGEWNAADANARGLAERRRRLQVDADRILEELALAERRHADAEFALGAERAKAVPVVRDSTQELSKNIGLLAQQLTSIAKDNSTGAKPAEVKQEPAAPPQMAAAPARISFSSLPALFPLTREPSSGWPIYLGAALGLCLGLIWVAVRESLTFRIPNAYTAKRLVDLPLLAVLPAYEPKSLAAAAAATEGAGLVERGGRSAYVPPSIDHGEPPPIGKRRPVKLERKRRRIAPWILAGAVVLLALAAHQAVSRGWLNPASPFTAEVWRESPARNIVSRSPPPAGAEAAGEHEGQGEP